MDPFPFQYSDIPQIPILGEDQSYFHSAQDQHFSQYASQDFAGRFSGFQGDPMDYNDFGSQSALNMQPMQRFLHGIDPAPFASGLLHANMEKSIQLQSQTSKQYERSWPFPEYIPYPSRDVSPGGTSASEKSSYAPQNELRSPHPTNSASYGSSIEFSPAAMSYPSPDRFNDKAYPAELPLPGHSINLRDLEIHHEEVEPAVEEHDHAGTPSQFEDEQEPVYTKTEVVTESYNNYPDTVVVASNVRDAESVQPMTQSDDDSDYSPGKNSKRRRSSTSSRSSGAKNQKRGGRGRKGSNASTHSTSNRVGKRGRGSNASLNAVKASNGSHGHDADARPFPCPLAGYGCQSNFSSKNEWKRHVGTQHIKLGFWRCDLCATTVDPHDEQTVYHNDFNRKDLFTQHLRRMHAAPPNASRRGQDYPVTEENLVEHQQRCYQLLRTTPTQSSCLFCDRVFAGPNAWDERMEHVGRHLEKDRHKISLDCADWNKDKELEQYLLNEGLIEQERSGEFKIGNGKPRRRSMLDSEDSEDDS